MQFDIEVLNPSSNVAVATLWTRKEVIVEKLKQLGIDSKVNIVGTLYTRYGINYMLYTLSKHPEVNVVVLFGADLSESGEALVKLSKGDIAEGLKLMWPPEQVRAVLEGVKVIDLREAFKGNDYRALEAAVKEHYSLGVRRTPPLLELKEVSTTSWPFQLAGLSVVEEDILRAWVKLLDAVITWGYLKDSDYKEKQKQLFGVQVVLNAEKALESGKRLEKYFSCSELEGHVNSLLQEVEVEGVSYSYGGRLRHHRQAGDQLEGLIARLASSPATRRAIALTWDFEVDARNSYPPCLILVQGDLSGDRYNQVAYFRSHDAYAGWPVNVYGLVVLMKHVSELLSKRIGRPVKPGFLVVFSASLHIYEHDFQRARDVVEKEKGSFASFIEDPKGNFIVRLRENGIHLQLRDREGLLAAEYKGSTAREVLNQVNLDALMPRHAAYLARELLRAEKTLKSGGRYVQDTA